MSVPPKTTLTEALELTARLQRSAPYTTEEERDALRMLRQRVHETTRVGPGVYRYVLTSAFREAPTPFVEREEDEPERLADVVLAALEAASLRIVPAAK